MKRFYEVLLKRAGVFAVLFALVLAGCGGATNTPAVATATLGTGGTAAGTDTSGGGAATAGATPKPTAPATDSVSGGATTPSASTPGVAGTMMSNSTPAAADLTPSGAITPGSGGTATVGGASNTSEAGATPVSDWKPGAHAKSIAAPGKLVSAGFLTVGSDASYPPQEYIANGNAVGLDIDIADEIATRLGLQLKVINFKFDDIIPALNAAQFDMVISAMTITDERKNVVDFVPYFQAGQAVLVKKGNPKAIKTLDDLSGLTAVAQQGTTEEKTLKDLNDKLAAAGKAKVNVVTFPTDTDAVDQLRIGRADATLHDAPVAIYYTRLNPDFEVAIPSFSEAPQGIAVAKNNKPMLDAVNAAITAMKSDGTLDAIKAKWGVK